MIRRSDYTAAALGAFEEPTPMSRAQTDHTTTTGGSCALSCAICLPYANHMLPCMALQRANPPTTVIRRSLHTVVTIETPEEPTLTPQA